MLKDPSSHKYPHVNIQQPVLEPGFHEIQPIFRRHFSNSKFHQPKTLLSNHRSSPVQHQFNTSEAPVLCVLKRPLRGGPVQTYSRAAARKRPVTPAAAPVRTALVSWSRVIPCAGPVRWPGQTVLRSLPVLTASFTATTTRHRPERRLTHRRRD